MSGPADPILLSAISKMFVSYLPANNQLAICNISQNYLSNVPTCSPLDFWTIANCQQIASTIMSQKITTQADALKLLGFIGQFGVAISTADPAVPAMQACTGVIDFTLVEYAYLWDAVGPTPFCRVRLDDGNINYSPIARVKELTGSSTSRAAQIIVDQYRANLQYFDATKFATECNTRMTYSDMVGPLLDLCGCYISVQNVPEFSTDEKSFLTQNPECVPSCLAAAVRYKTGSTPRTCQQSVCIADQINVSGTSAAISQICSQCPKRYDCVCYIHVNGDLINNETCNTVYTVNDQGVITGTSQNKPPAPGAGVKSAFEAMISSPYTWAAFAGTALIIAIIVFVLLYKQYTANKTKVTKSRTFGSSSEPLGYEMHPLT